MRFAATCNYGLSSVLKSEILRLGLPIVESTERIVRFSGEFSDMIRANLSLRTANRVYLECAEGPTADFDALFELSSDVPWKQFLPPIRPTEIRAVSEKSRLDSLPAIQKTVKKAIAVNLTGKTNGILPEDPTLPPVSVLALIRDDRTLLLLDTSGDPLHKRGYRTEGVEAPIKETLAAGLVLLSNWKFSEPFYDPFCGSGTIAIEAAMIAKNIAPGLSRRFAFETLPFRDAETLDRLKEELRSKEFRSKPHSIFASDMDAQAIEKARSNAETAGLSDGIVFEVKEFPFEIPKGPATLVTNPPYGERLESENDEQIRHVHQTLFETFKNHPDLTGGVITSNAEFALRGKALGMKDRKIPNGPIPCRFCFRTAAR